MAVVPLDDLDDPRLADYLHLREPSRAHARSSGSGGSSPSRAASRSRRSSPRPTRSARSWSTESTSSGSRRWSTPTCPIYRCRPVRSSRSPACTSTVACWPWPSARRLAAGGRGRRRAPAGCSCSRRVNDHENIGALFRNAAAFGVDAVVLDPDLRRPALPAVDPGVARPRAAGAVRAGRARTRWPAALDELRAAGFVTVALTPAPTPSRSARSWREAPERVALLLGAEGPGLTDEALAAVDRRVRIPMAPGVDSVNVATAAAIALSALHGWDWLRWTGSSASVRGATCSAPRSWPRRPVHGGDVAVAYRVDLADGRRVFAKTHARPPPGFFTTEAAGLTWLREAGSVLVPEVLAVADDEPAHLVLEWIERGAPSADTEAELGRALAALHQRGRRRASGGRTAAPPGAGRLPNEPRDTWAEFYARAPTAAAGPAGPRRPGPARRRLRRAGGGGRSTRRDLRRRPSRRPGSTATSGPATASSTQRGRSWLIDPAAHGGHREFDLAMMRLFGGFAPDVFAAYAEVHPLEPGWQSASRSTSSPRSSSTPSSSAAATSPPPSRPSPSTPSRQPPQPQPRRGDASRAGGHRGDRSRMRDQSPRASRRRDPSPRGAGRVRRGR